MLNETRQQQHNMTARAVSHVIHLLRRNKRVVVTSSTKAFIIELHAQIKTIFGSAAESDPNSKRVAVYYNGSSDAALPDTGCWAAVDAPLYSPIVSAGISFELLHFDELVAYMDNTMYTPPVDTVLQQRFRVRQLSVYQ